MTPLLLLWSCQPCPELEPLDYDDGSQWICQPGREDLCAAFPETEMVLADDDVEPVTWSEATDPELDCLYIYPTMDLQLRRGNTDLVDLEDEERAVVAQALRLRGVCDLWVPAYRQATLGTYFRGESKREPCLEVAWQDAVDAFDAWIPQVDGDFVLIGHSQGAQIVTRLLRERLDDDETLRSRLLAAYPIGWGVGTASGSTVGGSSESVPVCGEDSESGCLVAFKTFLSGADAPDTAWLEGEELVCVDPTMDGVLSMAMFENTDDYEHPAAVTADWVVYPEAYGARCTTGDLPSLEISWLGREGLTNPIDWDSRWVTGSNGSHVLDLSFTQGDITADIARRSQR